MSVVAVASVVLLVWLITIPKCPYIGKTRWTSNSSSSALGDSAVVLVGTLLVLRYLNTNTLICHSSATLNARGKTEIRTILLPLTSTRPYAKRQLIYFDFSHLLLWPLRLEQLEPQWLEGLPSVGLPEFSICYWQEIRQPFLRQQNVLMQDSDNFDHRFV